MNNHRKWAGWRSRKARERWAPLIAAGAVRCHVCGKTIRPDQPWDIDHIIPLSVSPELMEDPANLHPAHRACNRRAGASRGNRDRAKPKPPRSGPPPPAPVVFDPPRASIFAKPAADDPRETSY